MKTLLLTVGCLLALCPTAWCEAPHYVFPRDPSVLDAQRDFGAKGDGKADDTAALQQAIDASCAHRGKEGRGKTKALWLPNGTYRVTKTLVVHARLGPWLYGETRDGVVIKLDDTVQGVTCVLRTHPSDDGPTSADWFMRNLRNFTIDVGNNPSVDGIRYYATNSGCLQHVKVIGRGNIGINAGFLGQSGPNLIQDVEVDGFQIGILSQWIWGQTISRATIKNCREAGVEVSANVVALEDLKVVNTPLPLVNKIPNDWGHWGGVVALVGARFEGKDVSGPALQNHSVLYARDVTAEGFKQLLQSDTPGGSVLGAHLDEYISSPVRRLYRDAPERSLQLPIEREPVVAWPKDSNLWLCADDFGAVAGDNQDDSDAIESALKAAAKQGKTVVYFRGCGGGDPNWFTLRRPIAVPAPVSRVMGLGWARILRDGAGGFVVDDNSAPQVKFQNIEAFGGPAISLTNASTTHAMVVEGCSVHVVGDGTGPIFITDCPATVHLKKKGQRCWARQLNPEGNSDEGLVRNEGADLWCLGVKHEGQGVRFATTSGGRTEILGLFNYGGTKDELDPRPSFVVDNASFSVAALREIAFESHTALNKVREKRGNDIRVLDKTKEGGWIGWPLFSGYTK